MTTVFLFVIIIQTNMDKRKIIWKKSKYRKALFEVCFYEFAYYNFQESFVYPFAEYHREYAKFMNDWDNVLFIWHRESAKTQRAMWYLIRCICTKRKKYIIRANFDKSKAEMMLYKVREILQFNEKIITDYGNLYDEVETTKKKKKTKKTLKEFITTNWIFVQAQSLWTSTRGLNHLDNNILYRPDLYIWDDLDTTDSVKNPKVISDNYNKVKGEALWWLSSTSQVILIGNIIREDWLVPRFERDFKKSYQYIRMPTYIHDSGVAYINEEQYWKVWEFSWDRFVKTKYEAKKLNKQYKHAPRPPYISIEYLKERDGEIAFWQNHLLIPYIDWTTIIRKSMIRFIKDYPRRHIKVVMGIDPAFSEKTHADSMAITITAFHEKKRYVIYNEAFDWKDKDVKKFCNFSKNLYKDFNVNQITIEGNNGWEIIGKELRNSGMVCNIKHTKKDKVTRLIELQPAIENGDIIFLESFGFDHPMMQQLFIFPNGDHDDRVDSMMMSLENPPKIYKNSLVDTSTGSSFSKFSI